MERLESETITKPETLNKGQETENNKQFLIITEQDNESSGRTTEMNKDSHPLMSPNSSS